MESSDIAGLIYPCALGAWALLCAALAAIALRLRPELSERLDKLPRAAVPGAILGFIDLLWCIPNVKPIMSESLHPYLIPAACVAAVLAWIFLDKLLARATGGFLILLAHYFLKESFADALPGSAFFALLCLAFGTLGIFISGKPHLLRDILRRLCANPSWRAAAATILACLAVCSFATLSLHLINGHAA